MDIFPAELAMRIIEGAAFDFRFSVIHRQSVVHLASTSHTVYAVVAPILYHTLLINSANEARIQSLMFDEQTQAAAVRMCGPMVYDQFKASHIIGAYPRPGPLNPGTL